MKEKDLKLMERIAARKTKEIMKSAADKERARIKKNKEAKAKRKKDKEKKAKKAFHDFLAWL